MRYGICAGPDQLAIVEQAGFDYVEFTLNQVAGWTETEFLEIHSQVKSSRIAVEACNGFFPWSMKVVGPEADPGAISDYIARALPRAALLGVKTTVVGNGGARRIPDGMSREEGNAQFVTVLRQIGDEAAKVGITAAVEPLNSRESNYILSITEGVKVVEEANHPQVRLLADFYHMRMDNESMDAILRASGLLTHVHIANGQGRGYPLSPTEDCYGEFFERLHRIGYNGRVSIEASTQNMAEDAVRSLAMMKALLQ